MKLLRRYRRPRAFFTANFWIPTGILIAAPFLLFADVLFTGRSLVWGLPALQFVPWRYAAWLDLRAGILPLWNPLNGMGAPLLANYQLAIFYPPSWPLYLFAALGGMPALAWGHTLLVVLHLAWAGVGTARLVRDLGMNRLAQTVSGLAFSLCGYFTARASVLPILWAGAWLPWVLWAANRLVSPTRTRFKTAWLSLTVTSAMLLLAGHAQTAWYSLVLAGVWVLVWSWRSGGWKAALRAAGWFALAAGAAGLLSAAQLIPTAEYLLQSQRAGSVDYDLAMTYSFWPWRFLAFFAPNFFGNPGTGTYWGYAAYWEDAAYIGLLPLMMALKTLPQVWRKPADAAPFTNLVRFLWFVTAVSLLLALGRNTPIFPLLYRYIPTFDMFQAPARFLIWTEISLSLLAAVGVEQWRKPSGKGLRWLRRGLAAAVALVVGAGASWLVLRDVEVTFIGATTLAGIWALGTAWLTLKMPPETETLRRTRWTGLVVLWVLLDLLSASFLLHPSVDSRYYQANAEYNQPIRELLDGSRVYLSQDEDYRLKYSRFLRFTDFRPIEDRQQLREVLLPNSNLLDGIALTSNFDPLVPARFASWMKSLEALSPEERIPWLRLMDAGLVEQMNPWHSLGVDYVPVRDPFRWYWTACVVPAADEQESWQQLSSRMAQWSGLGTPDWVVLEGSSHTETCRQGATAEIRLVEEQSNRLVFQVTAADPGYLVLHDTWYPGWTVQVDEQPKTAPLHANDLFRAVTVPSGQHMVTFTYSPPGQNIALAISGLGWIAVAFVGFDPKLRPVKKHKS